MPKEDFRFHHSLRIRWGECDAQGIVFNAQYLNLLEVAIAEYYRVMGISLYELDTRQIFDPVTARVNLEYKSPAKIDDVIDIYMRICKIGTSSLNLIAEIYQSEHNQLLTTADIVYVAYDSANGKSSPIPKSIKGIISAFENL